MSISLYNTGVSGLLAAQQQLATTGNNITNVNTEGYTRQRAEQNTTLSLYTGGNYVGSGTYVEDVRRVYDQFSYKEQVLSQTSLSNAESLHIDLSQLDEVMTFSGGAINESLDAFYKSVNSITDNPSDLGLRNMILNQAEGLSADFNSLNDNFNQMVKSTNGEIEEIATHISQISQEIGKINEQMLNSQNAVSGQANNLFDARDRLVNELSQYTSVHTVTDNHNVMSVMIGSGSTLVAGITPMAVSISSGDPDASKTTLNLVSPNSAVKLSGSIIGGELGAKYEFRDEHLAQVQSEINRLAMVISETVNSVQHSGMNLNGDEGENLFTDINTTLLEQSRVLTPTKNTGTLQASVTITDVSKVPTDEFMVEYDGTNYTMTNLTNKSTIDLGTSGAINNNAIDEYGFQFIESAGTPASGDFFIIKPTENSASLMAVTLSDGSAIAASSAIEVTPSVNNTGSVSVEITNISGAEDAKAYAELHNLVIDIYENTPGTFEYRIYNSDTAANIIPPTAYVPGSTIMVDLPTSPADPVIQLEIQGMPSGSSASAPESFSIANSFGVGNSTNSRALGLTQEQSIINGNKNTFSQSLAASIGNVGSEAKSAELIESTAQALFTKAFNRNQSTSGVNLDEEAANLLRFQQAYQAASQIISTANTIFDTLLQAVR